MEKRINEINAEYISKFKNDLRDKIIELGLDKHEKANEFLEHVYEYPRCTYSSEDFVKRKRIKNVVPMPSRCVAKRANGEQCTRKRRGDCEFCGTHYKGTPHGIINLDDAQSSSREELKLDVFAEEIGGIVYYIDKTRNVFKTEDILQSKLNPAVIARWEKNGDRYTIPEFGLM
jgi:hypothetical protein